LSTGHLVRQAVRHGRFRGLTVDVAAGYVQANLTILPQAYADAFCTYCYANPRPCPVLAISEPGEPWLPTLGDDLDVRTDLSRYLVFEHGVEVAKVSDLTSLWRDDLVAVALGCSFSFDHLLVEAGVPVRHLSRHSNVAMWRTTIATAPAGPFHGPMVVSMRPMLREDVDRAVRITEGLPGAHGAPVHWGHPEDLGIDDLSTPHYGDPVPLEPGELPVFWPCGVTAQVAIQHARIPFGITHAPGCMLVTDVPVGVSR
jgi:uncharacterized protein YcsI (UPF0317 family)